MTQPITGYPTAKPVYGQPTYDPADNSTGENAAVRWDLSFGCTISVGADDGVTPTIHVNLSDHDLRDGGCQRSTTISDLRQYALYLLRLADDAEREIEARIEQGEVA